MIQSAYNFLGAPVISRETLWDVYDSVLAQIRQPEYAERLPEDTDVAWGNALEDEMVEERTDLLPNDRPLAGGYDDRREDGSVYLGGVNRGEGLSEYASNA